MTLNLRNGSSKILAGVISFSLASAAIIHPSVLLAAPPATAAPIPPSPVSGLKEPMIEVSVDSLEISELNKNILGLLWGQIGEADTNRLNFIERTIPSIFKVGELTRSAELTARFDALIQNNQIRVLANPTLLTKSGFEANFLVGGEIPYPQVGQGGVSGVDYKKYGVSLKILPQLTPRETVDAQINVTVSNPDSSVGQTINDQFVPGLATRETGTKVEVRDGETVVLSGIKQSRREKVITRVPVLGYIPLLGLLFRHKDERTTQTSLVLFVTFRLIKS
jgi:pilus assembly protein CpaC